MEREKTREREREIKNRERVREREDGGVMHTQRERLREKKPEREGGREVDIYIDR